MKKEDIYIGMRVVVGPKSRFEGYEGTIIADQCTREGLDVLIEFDDYVCGHSGLGWGRVEGRDGHCYWYEARELQEVIETLIPDVVSICYEDLFK